MNRFMPRLLMAPAVGHTVPVDDRAAGDDDLLLAHPLQPDAARQTGFIGLMNYEFFITDPDFGPAVAIRCCCWIGDPHHRRPGHRAGAAGQRALPGRGIVRVLLIAPFFVMPTVNALLWKHMMMNPVYGVLAQVWHVLRHATPVDWLTDWPLFSSSSWCPGNGCPLPALIFITSLQSLDRDQLEAAGMDGANYLQQLRFLTLPHLGRSIAVVIMIEMIFLMSVFAEIYTTTGGGPGNASTNVAFLIFKQALLNFDAGVASAGALFAVRAGQRRRGLHDPHGRQEPRLR
jgi:sorbitol/mannitol transport system permease protein